MVKWSNQGNFMKEEISQADFGIIEQETLPDKIADRILSMIQKKQLKPGDRLPPERELAKMMGVSRPVLREALRALSIMKIIENRRRAGTFITSLEPEMLVDHLELIFSLDDSTYLELLRARKVIEPSLTEMAARNMTDEISERLNQILVATSEAINDEEAFMRADLDLHQLICQAANNLVISRFMASITKLGVLSRRRTVRLPEVRKETLADHRKIVDALQARDTEAAKKAMEDHISNIENRLIEATEIDSDTF
jgi:GntR family transcriptional repressor for pyruvate dehydrogenase complex